MKTSLIKTAILLFFLIQHIEGQIIISPQYPQAGDTIKFSYQNNTLKKFALKVFISEKNKDPYVLEFPISDTCKSININILTNKNTLSLLSVLNLNNNIYDNNKGLGYITFFHANNKIIPESKSSIAFIYSMYSCESIIGIERNNIEAQKLFEEDFDLNPKLKIKYFRSYVIAFQDNLKSNFNEFEGMLNEFSNLDILNVKDLTIISRGYEKIKKNDLSNEIKSKRNLLFPQDRSVINQTTFKTYMNFLKLSDLKKFKEMYLDLCNQYKLYQTEEGLNAINYLKAKILAHKLKNYLAEKALEEWEYEISKLDVQNQANAYYLGALDLVNINAYLDYAEKMAKRTCDIQFLLLSNKRDWREENIMTDYQVKYYREKNYAVTLSKYGEVLLKNSNYSKARSILFNASFIYAKKEDTDINESLVKCYIQCNLIDSAKIVSKIFIFEGHSTPFIDNFYLHDKINSDEKNKETVQTVFRKVNVSLTKEKLLFFEFSNFEGKVFSINDFQGKIVILDFWATWCGHCIKGFSGMNNLMNPFKENKDVVFLYINTNDFGKDRKERAKKLIKEFGYDFSILFDENNDKSPKIGIESLPTKLIIDQNGYIRFKQVGEGIIDGINKLYSVIELLLNQERLKLD